MKVELQPSGADTERMLVKISRITLDHAVLEDIGTAIAKGVRRNIVLQRQADGTDLKENEDSTQKRKRKKGRPLLSLIDALRRFVRTGTGSWAVDVDPAKNDVVVSPATSELKKLSEYVQKMGYIGWFGMHRDVRKVVQKLIYHAFVNKLAKIR